MHYILLTIFLLGHLFAVAGNSRFFHLTSMEGLSQSEVYSFLKDRNGFMWIGTLDGLNRFDGYNIISFNVDKTTPSGLSNNTIRCLAEDETRRIWIGTDDGLNVLDPKSQRITQVILPGKFGSFFQIHDLLVSGGQLWIAGNRGLILLDIQKSVGQQKDNYPAKVIFPDSEETFFKIIKLSNGQYCVSNNISTTLFEFDSDKKECRILPIHPTIAGKGFTHIVEDHIGNIFMLRSTANDGLYRYTPSTKTLVHIQRKTQENSIISNAVSSLAVDADNNVWVGSYDAGLTKMTRKGDDSAMSFTYYQNQIHDSDGLKSNQIYSLFFSSDNIIWVGTLGSGVNYISLRQKPFKNYQIYRPEVSQVQSSNFVRALCYHQQRLYIGTQNDGLYLYHSKTKHYEKVGFGNQSIFHIISVSHKAMLVCSSQGAFFLNSENRIIPIPAINNSMFYAIHSEQNVYWLAGYLGVYRLELSEDKVKSVTHYHSQSQPALSVQNARVLLYNKERRQLWIGTQGGGLNIFSLNDQLLPLSGSVYKKSDSITISNNYIRSLCQTAADTFWIGTFEGLNRVVTESSGKLTFTTYLKKDGLPNNMIQSIISDDYGSLWMGTNYGLSKMDIKKESFAAFTQVDGLSSNEFSEHTVLKTDKSQLYFGTIYGITVFYPQQITTNHEQTQVLITDFHLFNETVIPNVSVKNRTVLSKPIFDTEEITLKTKENNFSFLFSAMNFSAPQKIKYAYKLEGYDTKWHITDADNRIATYTNINFGRYTFCVKATNSDGIWSDHITKVNIDIEVPLYFTWYAFLFYLLLLTGSILFITRYSVMHITTKKKMILDAEHNTRLHELDNIRTRFFINISHDLRTPLTLISGPLNKILDMKNLPQEIFKQLSSVQRNANKLKYLTEQLLDFRKMEVGKLKVNLRSVEINQFIKNEIDHFDFIIKDKAIDLIYDFRFDKLWVKVDTEKIAKILFNLLSNAIKYTAEGYIEITVDKTEENHQQLIIIQVKDTGIGIPKEQQQYIFDRFYNSTNSVNVSSYGIGLSHCKDLIDVMQGSIEVQSQTGNGTVFTVKIPVVVCPELPQNIGKTENAKPILSDITKKYTLLIVEDNSEMIQYISDCLSNRYHIITATEGEQACLVAREKLPDMVITDLVMPGMDGFELCHALKSNIETSHIPLIILTSHTDIQSRLQGIQQGADDYINKPFDENYLLTKIESLLLNLNRFKNSITKGTIFLEPSKINLTPIDKTFLDTLLQSIEKGIPDAEFSIEDLEKEMNMGHAKFYRKVKSLTGMSGKELLQDFRLKRSADIITTTDLNISEIAYLTGFTDPKYFSICFKQKYDVSPTDYKKSKKEE